MKKLIAALLACVLLCTAAIPALGESGYDILKSFLSQTGESLCNLGTPDVQPLSDPGKTILLGYIEAEKIMILGGVNADDQGELCGWSNVEVVNTLAVFVNVCTEWDDFAAMFGSGYTLMLAWDYGEGKLYITSSGEAAMFVEAVEGMLE